MINVLGLKHVIPEILFQCQQSHHYEQKPNMHNVSLTNRLSVKQHAYCAHKHIYYMQNTDYCMFSIIIYASEGQTVETNCILFGVANARIVCVRSFHLVWYGVQSSGLCACE